jgi:hypothetical protein
VTLLIGTSDIGCSICLIRKKVKSMIKSQIQILYEGKPVKGIKA